MRQVYPDYCADFACIKGDCRHSCCIGWEIDVDEETLARYDAETGELGQRLRANISRDGTPHFVLTENERCPFLNGEGLCNLIIARGDGALCDICREHPRFHNELPTRTESGLGLCCEAAARLILAKKEPTTLVIVGEGDEEYDELLALRDEITALLQDRKKPICERLSDALTRCNAPVPHHRYGEWAELLLSLERLDEAWTGLLCSLKRGCATVDLSAFDAHMAERQTEYEQLAVYLIYRYFANAANFTEAATVVSFTAFALCLVRMLGAVILQETGRFDLEDQIELLRLFSSEIEYSEENLEALLAALEH